MPMALLSLAYPIKCRKVQEHHVLMLVVIR